MFRDVISPCTASSVEVVHFQRKPVGAQVSIERLFDGIRAASSPDIRFRTHISPHPSKGILSRLLNLFAARKDAGQVNHIVGDVHYLALALPGAQTILTIHDCAVLNRLAGVRREVLRLLWFEWPARRAAVITTISAATRDELVSWLSPHLHSKIRVVPNSVRSEFTFKPKPFNSSSPVILQVGTGWNKNLERVARALVGTQCRLEIVGPLREEQRQILKDCGIQYAALGKLDDTELVAAYERCDLVIFASLYEGFGLPILEAQAVGRPVITSNRAPMKEVAGEGGALLVEPEDVGSLKYALERLITDQPLQDSLVASGLRNVLRFQSESIAAQYASLYRELAVSHVESKPGRGAT